MERPWYVRWWGIIGILYFVITAGMGIAFLAVSRRAAPREPPSGSSVLRVGGFTDRGDATVVPRSDASIVGGGERTLGASGDFAKLTIVEFSDFQCPFCQSAYPIIRGALATYGDRGVRFVYRDFPIDDAHPNARRLAAAAWCAHDQGKFWAFHDKLFQNAEALAASDLPRARIDATLVQYAVATGIDRAPFAACLASDRHAAGVQRDFDDGRALGVRGTPTWFFIIGSDTARARRVEGVIPPEALERLLERAIQ